MTELDQTLAPGALAPTRAMAVSPSGLLLACVTTDSVVVWDLSQRVVLARHPDTARSEAITWTSEETIVLGRYEGIDERQIFSGDRVRSWDRSEFGFVYAVQALEDGGLLVAGANEIVLLRDFEAVVELGPWPRQEGWDERVRSAHAHPDGDQFAVVFDETARVVDAAGAELAWFDEVRGLRFDVTGETLLAMSYRETTLYDWPAMQNARVVPFSLDDARAVPGGWLGWDHDSAVLFDEHGDEAWNTRYHDGLAAVAVHGSRFYTSSSMQWIGVRAVEAGELLTILPAGGGRQVDALSFDETGRYMVAADSAGRVAVWDVEEVTRVSMVDTSSLQPADAALEVSALRFADAAWLAEGALHVVCGQYYVWPDFLAADLGAVAPTISDEYLGVIGPNRRCALVEDYESDTTILVRLPDLTPIAILPPHDRYAERVVIEDGVQRLLFVDVGGEGTTLRVWDVAEGRYDQELRIDLPIDHAGFDPDGAVVGWLSTEPIHDWDADDELDEPTPLFFRWEPQTGDVMRWLDAPADLGDHRSVMFDGGTALFAEGAPAMLLDVATSDLIRLTEVPADCGALHTESGRCAVAMEHGVILLRNGEQSVLVCTTSDGSSWTMRDDQFEMRPSTWALA